MGKRWKLAGVALAAMGLMCLAGCTQADAVKAASMISAYLPTVSGLVNDAVSIASGLDPAGATTMQAVNAKIQTDLAAVGTVSSAYAASPSGSAWTSLGAAVDALVTDADQGLLAVLAIKDPNSQAEAKAALSAVDAAVHVVDGYLLAARTPDEAQAAAAQRTVKVQAVVRYWSPQDCERVEQALGASSDELLSEEIRQGF